MRATHATFRLAAGLLLLVGCSASPYGYSKIYEPLDEEERALQSAEAYDPVMAQRRPGKWSQRPVHLFGVVDQVRRDDRGGAFVTLSLRALEPRNLCASSSEDTCRVTVSDREHGKIVTYLALSPETAAGPGAIRQGSLLRVVGNLKDPNPHPDALPLLQARYVRHWPVKYYVTTQARAFMLR